MFRQDALSNTTPAVTGFIKGLTQPADAVSATCSSGSSSGAESSPHATGHVLLTSLMCVSRLARRRQLLLHTETPAGDASAALPPSTAGTNLSRTLLVRLVLSLLGQTMMEVTTANPSSASAGTQEAATGGATLPWWPEGEPTATEERDLDVVYAVRYIDSDAAELGSNTATAPATATAEVTESACAPGAGAVRRLALRSRPVPVFAAELIEELAEDAQRCADVVMTDSDSDDDDAAEAAVARAAAAASVVERARAVADACFRRHEARCLQQLAAVVDALLVAPSAAPHPAGAHSARVHETLADLASCAAAERAAAAAWPEWVVEVPIYGVALRVEDSQATRLARVRRLTTPLLLAATSSGSSNSPAAAPLSAVTHVLALLHSWCTAERHGGSALVATPTRVQLTALRDLIEHYRVAWEGENGAGVEAAASPCSCATLTLSPCMSAAPACVVHCQLGVSRSPSVVMLFYMDLFATPLRRAVTAAAAAGNEDGDAAALRVFHGLLSALVQARRRVRPNVCFAVQLLALWQQDCGAAG